MYPFIRKYKDGSIERFLRSPFVLAPPDQGSNRGVATKDVVVDKATGVSVRLFLPSRAAGTAGRNRLPLVLYVHGGSFCTESAFGRTYHRYATSLAASAGALVVSVEYRLGPEFPIPAAYDDAWAALQWAASLSDPWLASYADPTRTFKDAFGYGMAMKSWGTRSSMARNSATYLKTGRVGPSKKISVRLPMPAAVPWTCVINNFF
ncbi:hypothetical protein CFC21_055203 [Triticum aestivum]|uniref:Alpha/beta hydrolase fold-3 domain-containing protein n=3 Tax=Triticum TaxID=4564 RepID=A0A9R0SQB3_TRITD|nr:hypothetical protein CFC21_055203 [Triticum aestivum]VAH98973.1 unnamed protein product [Triticum turgidum subsp. durum]